MKVTITIPDNQIEDVQAILLKAYHATPRIDLACTISHIGNTIGAAQFYMNQAAKAGEDNAIRTQN